jgi:hypothetical protein
MSPHARTSASGSRSICRLARSEAARSAIAFVIGFDLEAHRFDRLAGFVESLPLHERGISSRDPA